MKMEHTQIVLIGARRFFMFIHRKRSLKHLYLTPGMFSKSRILAVGAGDTVEAFQQHLKSLYTNGISSSFISSGSCAGPLDILFRVLDISTYRNITPSPLTAL
ncbi:MAG: hypothetical protein NTY86_20130 [Deltaproteobacteria bacterium]|nr:hypothetical protein [Deltaproteobacteria bacterium]